MRLFGRRGSELQQEESPKPGMWRLGFVSGVVAFASVLIAAAYLANAWIAHRMAGVDPPRTIGVPLHVSSERSVFLLTVQEETRRTRSYSRWSAMHSSEQVSHVDLWRFDVSSAQPVWRRRVLTERDGGIVDIALLGADGDRLWMFLRQPLVLSAATGEVLANAEMIEARNPALKGVLPRQLHHYGFFDGYGFAVNAADARAWLLDAQSLTAAPWHPKKAVRRSAAVGAPHYAPSSISSFQKRGLLLTRDWLGVLTEDEAAVLNRDPDGPGARPGRRGAYAEFLEYTRAPPDLSHAGAKRYRLWRAKVQQVSAAPAGWPKELPDNWGLRPKYSEFTVLEESPELLQAGLLSDGRSKLPLYLLKPDSILILHRDRIDVEGRLHVTRMAGPDGRTLWDAALPLSILQAVMPAPEQLVLFGRGFVPGSQNTNPYNSAHEWLISLDNATGAVKTFNITTADAERERKMK